LERFLIANRDEYLKHSALNYTAEQKHYNNWLTERLLEVAARHNYVFDPEEFNFVAVRDRIRCYYKSFVQTARKRGMPLLHPSLRSSNGSPVTTKRATTSSPTNDTSVTTTASNDVASTLEDGIDESKILRTSSSSSSQALVEAE
jgi:hypothetical protein